MTEQTQEETLLKQVLGEFQNQGNLLQQLMTENQKLNEELQKTKIDLLALAEGSEKTFDKIGSILSQIQQKQITDVGTQPTGQQKSTGNMIGNLLEGILKKLNEPSSGASVGNDLITGEIGTMVKDNFKMQLKIMQLQSQAALKATAKAAGVTIPDVAEHIVVAPE